jgi:hypothetical protein
MRSLALTLVFFAAVALGTAATTDEEARAFHLDKAAGASGLAQELVRTYMSEKEWQAKSAAIRKRFDAWHEEHQEDGGTFLNDGLAGIVLAAAGGNVEHLKEAAIWIAMYKELDQPLPSYAVDFIDKNLESINALLANFSWKSAGDYVKTKAWQKYRKDKAHASNKEH